MPILYTTRLAKKGLEILSFFIKAENKCKNVLLDWRAKISLPFLMYFSGQSYKHFTLANYNSRVVPDWKIPHFTTLES